jgi:hypothetical protein
MVVGVFIWVYAAQFWLILAWLIAYLPPTNKIRKNYNIENQYIKKYFSTMWYKVMIYTYIFVSESSK